MLKQGNSQPGQETLPESKCDPLAGKIPDSMTAEQYRNLKKKKKPKYGNKHTYVDGIKFDSQKEARRWVELKDLEEKDLIWDLERQVKFDLVDCKYYADFSYCNDHGRIVEDVKGVKTAMYKLKKKMMKRIHGIEIIEV